MLDTKKFGRELKRLGFHFYSGVPCSFLENLINYSINNFEHITAANEGDAIAIASGAYLGGKKAVVFMQNSGLANAVSPLVSLNYPFQIPLLGFVSLRGAPDIQDEPQHELMGKITTQLLELMQVKWMYLADDIKKAQHQLLQANQFINKNQPFFFVVKKGTFEEEPLKEQVLSFSSNQTKKMKTRTDQMPTRLEVLTAIHALQNSQAILIATTGKTGRELYEIDDACNHLYMVGSMGCVSSLGLGLALSQKNRDIIIIDGDGSLLMHMGNLATNGHYHPDNMLHILLDNHSHDSTGGQRTVSHNVNFVDISAACGYKKSIYIHNVEELKASISEWKKTKGLTFLYMRIAKGSKKQLSRPKIKPYEVKERLQNFIKNDPQLFTKGENTCKS
ncbi:phosphonopyruvate decarboxylase [Shimazuella kribbensis]|uniref:phosphonopyruvate decarboxylase n=1 Tax=Shimazuella kribbensis TaxID=139808 RepID=UPI000427CDFF|nr:phosphonopyruvate decarboxylase [Shimazuella kribbensis]